MQRHVIIAGLLTAVLALFAQTAIAQTEFLNVSYDPTRELYEQVNAAFLKQWEAAGGRKLKISASHAGSGSQARSVTEGLAADVLTLALEYDVDAIAQKGLIAKDWIKRLPDNSSPYTSTIVFLVRKGNPKGIKDWSDIAKPGVSVITPNPKTSGGARWNYLAAWGYALKQPDGSEQIAKDFVRRIYKNVPVLDSGARASTMTFVQRGLGDVLLAWENEAYLAIKESDPNKFDIVTPSVSILAEPSVAIVDRVVDRKKTRDVAEAYLKFLYSPEGQEIAARNFYRPRNTDVVEKYNDTFKKIDLLTIDRDFGGWAAAQKKHFDSGGTFDQIFEK